MTSSLSYVPYVMGGADRGPRVDVMGGPDPPRYPVGRARWRDAVRRPQAAVRRSAIRGHTPSEAASEH